MRPDLAEAIELLDDGCSMGGAMSPELIEQVARKMGWRRMHTGNVESREGGWGHFSWLAEEDVMATEFVYRPKSEIESDAELTDSGIVVLLEWLRTVQGCVTFIGSIERGEVVVDYIGPQLDDSRFFRADTLAEALIQARLAND